MVSEDLSKQNSASALTCEQTEQRLKSYIAALPADLRSCVVEGGRWGPVFDHPFFYQPTIYALLDSPSFTPAYVAKLIFDARNRYGRLCAEGEFEAALLSVYKPHRREFLLNLLREHGVENLYNAIRVVWTGVDFFSHDYSLWCEVWSHVRESEDGRRHVMHVEDHEPFDSLPEVLTVYRGFQREDGGEEYGWSWSLKRETAEWFARRWPNGAPMIATVTVGKSEVLAYFNDRDEAEIVLHPEELSEISIEALSSERTAA